MRDAAGVTADVTPPSGQAVRRFWLAWLVFLLVLLAASVSIILVGALSTDPASIPPPG